MTTHGELADLNFAEMCRAISRNAGGRALDVDGLLLWSGTHPSPALINGVIRTRGAVPPAREVLAFADAWFGEMGHGYGLHVRIGRDDDLVALAGELGLHAIINLPVMVWEGRLPEVHLPEGYNLRRVESTAELRDYIDVVAEPFEMPDEIPTVFARPESILAPFTGAVLVRDPHGRPVAGAWTHVSHGVAGVGFVGTLAHERGRGLGTAATWGAMHLGFEMGATIAALQASPKGLPVYRRMGYVEVGEYRLYGREH